MNIQTRYSFMFATLVIAQLLCILLAATKSNKSIKKYTILINAILIMPLMANLLIIGAHTELLATIGYFCYYIGVTLTVTALVSFTNAYCQGIDNPNKTYQKPIVMYILAAADILQLLVGIVTKHVFKLEQILVEGRIYYRSISLIGLTIHRVICYGIFICAICIFILAVIKSSKFYKEKYSVILATLIISGVFQAIVIFTKTAMDCAVVPYGITGIIIFYFAIRYRPLKLLDTVLTNFATSMDNAIYIFDGSNRCVWANDIGLTLMNNIRLDQIQTELIKKFGNFFDRGPNWSDEFNINNKEFYFIEKRSVKSEKMVDGYSILVKNITNNKKALEQELYNANHDTLTGLNNQAYLYKLITKKLQANIEKEYCVLFMNIKNFKIVNDIFGTKIGDRCIIRLSKWIKRNLNDPEIIYGRLVGDTFGIFMPKDKFNEEVFTNGLFDFSIKANNRQHPISIHIGVYNITDKNMNVSIMFDRAHLAIVGVEDNYGIQIRYYDENIRKSIIEEQNLISNLSKAINETQIKPYLQPIINKQGKVVGCEALARWVHPELGFLPPNKFIPIFEKNGMIADVDRHIWECCCAILSNWKDTYPELFISINISPKDFYFMDVVYELRQLIDKYEINPNKLRVEITETAIIDDMDNRIEDIRKLKSLGFIVEMDDFGSGYSSLNTLKDLPVDILKIDMGFLDKAKDTDRAKCIVYNIILMSDDLHMKSLTEGVETMEQYDLLIQMGCELFQGYYFAKPMPLEEFEQFIKEHR